MKLQSIGTAAEQSSDALKTLATTEVLNASPLLPLLEFYPIDGNSDKPRKADTTMTAGGTRAIGSAFSDPKTNTPAFADLSLVIYGDEVNTDAAYERRGRDIGSQRASDLKKFAQSLGRYLTDACFNHTGASSTIKGFKKLSEEASRDVLFDAAGDGIVPTGNGNTERKKQQAFMEFINGCIEDMQGAGQLYMAMNGSWKTRLASIGREFMSTGVVEDIFGGKQTIDEFSGIPIINPKFTANGSSLIIGNDEVVDLTTDRTGCSSIYFLIFGEESDIAFGSNVGLHVIDNGKVKSQYVTTCEIDIACGLLNPLAIKRAVGFKLA